MCIRDRSNIVVTLIVGRELIHEQHLDEVVITLYRHCLMLFLLNISFFSSNKCSKAAKRTFSRRRNVWELVFCDVCYRRYHQCQPSCGPMSNFHVKITNNMHLFHLAVVTTAKATRVVVSNRIRFPSRRRLTCRPAIARDIYSLKCVVVPAPSIVLSRLARYRPFVMHCTILCSTTPSFMVLSIEPVLFRLVPSVFRSASRS